MKRQTRGRGLAICKYLQINKKITKETITNGHNGLFSNEETEMAN